MHEADSASRRGVIVRAVAGTALATTGLVLLALLLSAAAATEGAAHGATDIPAGTAMVTPP